MRISMFFAFVLIIYLLQTKSRSQDKLLIKGVEQKDNESLYKNVKEQTERLSKDSLNTRSIAMVRILVSVIHILAIIGRM